MPYPATSALARNCKNERRRMAQAQRDRPNRRVMGSTRRENIEQALHWRTLQREFMDLA